MNKHAFKGREKGVGQDFCTVCGLPELDAIHREDVVPPYQVGDRFLGWTRGIYIHWKHTPRLVTYLNDTEVAALSEESGVPVTRAFKELERKVWRFDGIGLHCRRGSLEITPTSGYGVLAAAFGNGTLTDMYDITICPAGTPEPLPQETVEFLKRAHTDLLPCGTRQAIKAHLEEHGETI